MCAGRFPPISPQRGSRHGAAPAFARPVAAARALLRPILPPLPAPRRSVPQNPPEQSSGLRDCGRIRPGEGAPAAEVKVPQLLKVWGSRSGGGAQPPLGAAGAAGPGGLRGLRLRQELPLQRLGGVALPPPADPHPPLPHPALRGPHGPRAGARGRFWGLFGDFGVTSDPAELRHCPAGPEPAHHHPQQADPDRHQRPAGPHGAALGGHHGAPVWGGPGPNLHLPHGNRGSPFGLDLRGLGHLQWGPAGPGAASGGLQGPPSQKGVTPKSPAPQKTPTSPQKSPQNWDFLGLKKTFLGLSYALGPPKSHLESQQDDGTPKTFLGPPLKIHLGAQNHPKIELFSMRRRFWGGPFALGP